MINGYEENYNDGYYHIGADIEKYPEAWCFICYSRRGPGKTYSALLKCYNEGIVPIYMKRTNQDVEMICTANENFDASPYAPISRDYGLNIVGKIINDGLGAFYNADDEGNASGTPICYVVSLNKTAKIKGIDFSQCEWMIFDEFIPLPGEVVKQKEGEMVLSFYMTAARDREKRGLPPLKLIMFANAEEISTPITEEFEIVDLLAELNYKKDQSYIYIEERGILIHHITDIEIPLNEKEKGTIFKAFKDTAWGRRAFGGEFSGNDFSNVMSKSIRKMSPYARLLYRQKNIFIYLNKESGEYYVTDSPFKNSYYDYDLNRENDQKKYWLTIGIDLRNACIDDRVKFKNYSYYNLVVNFKKIFKNIT